MKMDNYCTIKDIVLYNSPSQFCVTPLHNSSSKTNAGFDEKLNCSCLCLIYWNHDRNISMLIWLQNSAERMTDALES